MTWVVTTYVQDSWASSDESGRCALHPLCLKAASDIPILILSMFSKLNSLSEH